MNLKNLKAAAIACLLFALLPLRDASSKELWVYCQANLLVDREIDRVTALMKRSAPLGYSHFLIADSKFARLNQMDRRYFDNVKRLQQTARGLGIAIVPAVHSVGYSNDLLSLDPNLAEGLPVIDAPYVVKDSLANVDTSACSIELPVLQARNQWGFIDDSFQIDGDAITSTVPHSANARCMKKVTVEPFQHYHVSVMVKTDDFDAPVEIKPIDENGRVLSYTNLRNSKTQDWTVHHITFNSLTAKSINLYIGAWGPTRGALSLRSPTMELSGAVNLLRRPTTPVTVKQVDASGQQLALTEGTDFESWSDPRMGVIPYEGEYEVWHEAPPIKLKKPLADGTKLLVSYYHTHIVHDGQVSGAINCQAFENLLVDQSLLINKLFPNSDYMMSHDEYRVMGWTPSDLPHDLRDQPPRDLRDQPPRDLRDQPPHDLSNQASHDLRDQPPRDLSNQPPHDLPSHLLSHNVKVCFESLRNLHPAGRVFTWNDMFDPYHNAVDHYYLVNGTLEKTELPTDVVVMNWNAGKREQSLQHFADKGHHQIIAGYYDQGPQEIVGWLDTVVSRELPHIDGVMYTTWQRNFDDLESFAANVKEHSWYQ